MRWFWSRYKAGLLSIVLPAVVLFIGIQIFGGLWNVASWLNEKFVGSGIGQWSFFLGILNAPFLVGWLLSWRTFRELVLKSFSKIPLLSIAVNFFLNKDYVDRMMDGGLPEVIFQHTEYSWSFGTVTNEKMLPVDLDNPESPLIPWVVILGPPTAPISVTAQMYLRPKRTVTFTGRVIKDTAITTASLGFKFDLDPRKFKSGRLL